MRQTLFDKIKNEEIDYSREMERIEHFFAIEKNVARQKEGWVGVETYYITIEEYIQNYLFSQWKYRENFISIDDIRSSLKISTQDIRKNNQETLLYYFEFITNMLILTAPYNTCINKKSLAIINDNIKNVLDKLNFKIKEMDDYAIIVGKDPNTTAIAEIYEDISDNVVEYRRFSLKGNLARKKEILSTLSKKIEAIESTLKNNAYGFLINEITSLLNNLDIRHNNIEGKNAKEIVIDMKSDELENWYDKTYDTILLALMVNHYLDYKNNIKDLNKQLKNK